MVTNNIKISQKMKKKLVQYRKKHYKMRKNASLYYNYQKLFSFGKFGSFLELGKYKNFFFFRKLHAWILKVR